jgi:hypothetical protein
MTTLLNILFVYLAAGAVYTTINLILLHQVAKSEELRKILIEKVRRDGNPDFDEESLRKGITNFSVITIMVLTLGWPYFLYANIARR